VETFDLAGWLSEQDPAVRVVYTAAREGRLERVPAGLLTPDNMLFCDPDGESAFLWAALNKQLDLVPESLITAKNLKMENVNGVSNFKTLLDFQNPEQIPKCILYSRSFLTEKDSTGGTALHALAINGFLSVLPDGCIDDSSYLICDGGGVSVLHAAINGGCVGVIPLRLLTLKNITARSKNGNAAIHSLANAGNFDPVRPVLTRKSLLMRGCGGYTPLHCAARSKHLDQLLDWVIPADFLVRDAAGITPLHLAIGAGDARLLPKELLGDSLLIPSVNGVSPLYLAAAGGHLSTLPCDICTYSNLITTRDNLGNNAMHGAALGAALMEFPRELITVQTMLEKNLAGKTVLDCACNEDKSQVPLGLDFPEEFRDKLGERWWGKNQQILATKGTLQIPDAGPEIDLF